MHSAAESECGKLYKNKAAQRDARNSWSGLMIQMQTAAQRQESQLNSRPTHRDKQVKVGSQGGGGMGISCKWGVLTKSKGDRAQWKKRKAKGKLIGEGGQLGDNLSKVRAAPKLQSQVSILSYLKATGPS